MGEAKSAVISARKRPTTRPCSTEGCSGCSSAEHTHDKSTDLADCSDDGSRDDEELLPCISWPFALSSALLGVFILLNLPQVSALLSGHPVVVHIGSMQFQLN
mmetsp:Transcript_34157/g.96804  ORF Transcript_34157/g.96804 Transcript_34157/m.96804 type:complete len:103 (-) Transcript_34157:4794-5102(-)